MPATHSSVMQLVFPCLRLLPLLVLCTSCAGDPSAPSGCSVLQPSTPLPAGLEESSGVAPGRARPEILWTHSDSGGDPVLYGVRADGRLVQRVRVRGARGRDWEDIAAGPCPSGNCLYVGDIGDNEGDRDEVAAYRISEPEAGAREARAERFPFRYPEGPRDAESLFVLPSGELFVVTKGRESPITLYRYPPPLRADEVVTLQRVVDLGADPGQRAGMVTAAAASPDGEWIAIRTYKTLTLHRTRDLLGGNTGPARIVDLTPIGEAQGEAVALLDDGRVVLTSEGGFKQAPGTIAVLRCTLPTPGEAR